MKKLILIDVDGVVLNWDDAFEWWAKKKYRLNVDASAEDYTGGVYGRYKKNLAPPGAPSWVDLVSEFNCSDDCANLPPLRDSIKYIRRLHEQHGFVFHAITAFGSWTGPRWSRQELLKRYFGAAIVGCDFVDLAGDKTEALRPYKDSGIPWIEDKVGNAELGGDLGLKPYLMMHEYNAIDALNMDDGITMVADWKEVCYNLTEGKTTN